ncbi:MAG: hypothetical protein WC661_07260 [Opitutaceae bacterium]|jgi:hypothetical protein
MVVIRRLVDRHRAYTGIFLPGEPPKIFPTSDVEHGRILQIYKQDKPYEGIINDFTQFEIGPPPAPAATSPHPRKKAQPDQQHRRDGKKRRP